MFAQNDLMCPLKQNLNIFKNSRSVVECRRDGRGPTRRPHDVFSTSVFWLGWGMLFSKTGTLFDRALRNKRYTVSRVQIFCVICGGLSKSGPSGAGATSDASEWYMGVKRQLGAKPASVARRAASPAAPPRPPRQANVALRSARLLRDPPCGCSPAKTLRLQKTAGFLTEYS